MKSKSDKSTLVYGGSSIDILRKEGIDIDSLSEGHLAKEIIIETAKEIRAMRNDAGLSQTDLAKAAGMSQADISRIESGLGTRGPSIETIYRLASACGYALSLELKPSIGHSTELSQGVKQHLSDDLELDANEFDQEEVGTMMDLAKAYLDMGGKESARSSLNEIVESGLPEQLTEAEKLLRKKIS